MVAVDGIQMHNGINTVSRLPLLYKCPSDSKHSIATQQNVAYNLSSQPDKILNNLCTKISWNVILGLYGSTVMASAFSNMFFYFTLHCMSMPFIFQYLFNIYIYICFNACKTILRHIFSSFEILIGQNMDTMQLGSRRYRYVVGQLHLKCQFNLHSSQYKLNSISIHMCINYLFRSSQKIIKSMECI